MYGLGTHLGDELGWIIIGQVLIVLGKGFKDFKIFFLRQQVTLVLVFIRADTRLDHDVSFIVYDALEFLRTHPQQVAGLVRKTFEIPYMNHGYNQFDMTHAFPANLLLGYFYTATVADDPLIADPFIFSAGTFVILNGPEYALAEQTIPFGFVGSVVYGFRL